jgi:hypothetical protein
MTCGAVLASGAALKRRGMGVAGRSAECGEQRGAAATPLDDGAEAGAGRGGDAPWRLFPLIILTLRSRRNFYS